MFEINAVIEYGEIKLKIVETPECRCARCYFNKHNYPCKAPKEFFCTSGQRKDNKSVFFLKVN